MKLYELSLNRPEGILYCRIIAYNLDQAIQLAATDDYCWKDPNVGHTDIGPVTGDNRLVGMKMFSFIKKSVCPTCGNLVLK